MHRNRYIRFFVSSTFADMALERDILASIFKKLETELIVKGWRLEYADLRWGISNESATHNQTMTLCLDELERCKRLSPKPNFIILCGERYGWIPLPEKLESVDYSRAYDLADYNERLLLETWYRYDKNHVNAKAASGESVMGIYYLLPREGDMVDDDVFESRVARPLRDLFARVAGSAGEHVRVRLCGSATEREIYQGAFSEPDTVVAYTRVIDGVPADMLGVLKESDPARRQAQTALRETVGRLIPGQNRFDARVDYRHYTSDEWRDKFRREMESRLRHVVDKVLADNDLSDCEYERSCHYRLMETHVARFVRREAELKRILAFCKSSSQRNIMIVKGSGGIGKTALLSRAAADMQKQGTDVIFRSIGATKESVDPSDLIQSIWDELFPLTTVAVKQSSAQDKALAAGLSPVRNTKSIFSNHNWEILATLLTKCSRRLVLIIDGVNKSDSVDVMNVAFEYILTHVKSPDIRIILSETDVFDNNHLLSSSGREPEIFELGPVDNNNSTDENSSDAEAVLGIARWDAGGGISLNHNQMALDNEIVALGDCSPLMLRLYASCTARLRSWESLAELPRDLGDIITLTVDLLDRYRGHDSDTLRLVLAIMALSTNGVTDKMMLQLLGDDKEVYNRFVSESRHSWAGDGARHSLPPSVWGRILGDMEFLFEYRSSKCGITLQFVSEKLRRVVYDRIVKDDYLLALRAAAALYYFCIDNLDSDDSVHQRIAVSDILTHTIFIHKIMDELGDSSWRENALSHLGNIKLLSHYIAYFHDATELVDQVLELYTDSPDILADLQTLRRELMNLNGIPSARAVECLAANFPKSSRLQKIASASLSSHSYFSDRLADYNNVISAVTGQCRFTGVDERPLRLSDDGRRISTITDNGRFKIYSLESGRVEKSLRINCKCDKIAVDGNFTCLAFVSGLELTVYDIVRDRVAGRHTFIAPSDDSAFSRHRWLSVSDNGKAVAAALSSEQCVYLNTADGEIRKAAGTYKSGMLSPSGDCLWIIAGATLYIHKLFTSEFKRIIGDTNVQSDIAGALTDGHIMFCSENLCMVTDRKKNNIIVRLKGNHFDLVTYQGAYSWGRIAPDEHRILQGRFITFSLDLKGGNVNWQRVPVYGVNGVSADLGTIWLDGLRGTVDIKAMAGLILFNPGDNCGVNNICSDSEGNTVIATQGKNSFVEHDLNAVILRRRNAYRPELFAVDTADTAISISASAISPDGRLMAFATYGPFVNKILVYTNEARPIRVCEIKTEKCCNALAFSADGRRLAGRHGTCFGDFLRACYVIDLKTKHFKVIKDDVFEGYGSELQLSVDGNIAYYPGFTGFIRIDIAHDKIDEIPLRLKTIHYRNANFADDRFLYVRNSENTGVFCTDAPDGGKPNRHLYIDMRDCTSRPLALPAGRDFSKACIIGADRYVRHLVMADGGSCIAVDVRRQRWFALPYKNPVVCFPAADKDIFIIFEEEGERKERVSVIARYDIKAERESGRYYLSSDAYYFATVRNVGVAVCSDDGRLQLIAAD